MTVACGTHDDGTENLAALGGLLGEAVGEGVLQLGWSRGSVQRASLRTQRFGAEPVTVLRELLNHPLAAELAELRLPFYSARFALSELWLPALRQLSVGPFWVESHAAECGALLAELRFARAPLLRAPEVHRFGHAWLSFANGTTQPLRRSRELDLGDCTVFFKGGWHVRRRVQGADMSFNGRSRIDGELQPGDTVSCGEATFQFQAERRCPVSLLGIMGCFGSGGSGSSKGPGRRGWCRGRRRSPQCRG